MRCTRCGRDKTLVKTTTSLPPLCASCFLKLVEDRVRESLRPLDLLHRRRILFFDDGSAAARVTGIMLHALFDDAHKSIIALRAKDRVRRGCLMPLSLEEVCAEGIAYFLDGARTISLPCSATEGVRMVDLERYCAIKALAFRARRVKAHPFLEELQRTDAQTYTSCLRSLHALRGNAAPSFRSG